MQDPYSFLTNINQNISYRDALQLSAEDQIQLSQYIGSKDEKILENLIYVLFIQKDRPSDINQFLINLPHSANPFVAYMSLKKFFLIIFDEPELFRSDFKHFKINAETLYFCLDVTLLPHSRAYDAAMVLLRYNEFFHNFFKLAPKDFQQLKDLLLESYFRRLIQKNIMQYEAALVLMHFKYLNIFEKILPLLEKQDEIDISWFDYGLDDLNKPNVYHPEWIKSGIFQTPQKIEQREVILRALIDYAPKKVAPHVILFLKQWKPLPFVTKLSQTYQREFAPGVFNRIIHACIMCNVTISPKAVESLWPVLPTYSHTELVAWLYHLRAQGQTWDHHNHQWLEELLHSNDRDIVERALVIRQHFGLLST